MIVSIIIVSIVATIPHIVSTNLKVNFPVVSVIRASLFYIITSGVFCISHFPAPTPPPPRADSRALAFFLPWVANSRGWGLSCQIPRGEDEKRGQMPRPRSTLQHFSLTTQSSSAILSILMCDFFVSINVFLCNSAILIKTSRRDDTSL